MIANKSGDAEFPVEVVAHFLRMTLQAWPCNAFRPSSVALATLPLTDSWQTSAPKMVAHLRFYLCDQNGGKHNLRLAVLHPFWEHGREATTKSKASGAHFRSGWSAKGRRSDAATIGREAEKIEFVRLEA